MFPNSPNCTITLLKITSIPDSIGNKVLQVISRHTVIGSTRSITTNEYQSKTEISKTYDKKVNIQSLLYNDEKYALFNEALYKIERTYVSGQFIELYLGQSDINYGDLT